MPKAQNLFLFLFWFLGAALQLLPWRGGRPCAYRETEKLNCLLAHDKSQINSRGEYGSHSRKPVPVGLIEVVWAGVRYTRVRSGWKEGWVGTFLTCCSGNMVDKQCEFVYLILYY